MGQFTHCIDSSQCFFYLVSHLEHVDARVDEELTWRFDSVAYIAPDPLASSKSPRAKERGGGTGTRSTILCLVELYHSTPEQ